MFFRKSSAPIRSSPQAETVTKLAPWLMNSTTPAVSAGLLPPTPANLPPARIRGMTSLITRRTSDDPGLPRLWPRSEAATWRTSAPDTWRISSRLRTASMSSTMGMTSNWELTQAVASVPGYADAVVLCPASAHTAVAVWIVPRGPCYGRGLLTGVDVGYDYPLETAVEEPEYGMLGVVGNACYGCDIEGLCGAYHVFYLVKVGWSVFTVYHHKVVTQSAEYLHHVWSVSGDDGSEDDFAFVEFSLGRVRAHEIVPPDVNAYWTEAASTVTGEYESHHEPSNAVSWMVGLPQSIAEPASNG